MTENAFGCKVERDSLVQWKDPLTLDEQDGGESYLSDAESQSFHICQEREKAGKKINTVWKHIAHAKLPKYFF